MTSHAFSTPVGEFLARIHLGIRQAHKALTLWPLHRVQDSSASPAPEYVTLGEALEAGNLLIDEVDRGGSVPHVRVSNSGSVAVLFLFGEEILGAKQNRVANASFLVPGKSEVVLDVSCVEAGRWSRPRGARFRHSDHVLSHSLRKKMALKVERARRRGQGFRADQAEVWADIGTRLQRSGAVSETAAYSDYRQSRSTDLDDIAKAFHPLDGQIGFVAAIGDEVAGIELVGRPAGFKAAFRALLRSFAIDAVDASLVRELEKTSLGDAPRFDAPETFLKALAEARVSSSPSLGAGDDLRLQGNGVSGCALHHGDLIHLTAFPSAGALE